MMWMAECKKTIFINHKYTPGKTTWHMVSNKVFLRIITKVTEIFNKLMRVNLQIALIGGLIITIIAGITNSLVLWLHVDFQMILLCRLIITLAGKSPFHDDELRPGWQPRWILFKTELKVFPISRLHKWALLRKKLLEKMGPPNRSLMWHSKVFQVISPYISFLLTSHFSVFWWWLDSWSWGLEALHSIILIVSSVCLSGLSDWSWRWTRISCWTWGFGLESCRLSENYAVAL